MAAMIAMFYLGTASGVVGAVLLGATRSREGSATEQLLAGVAHDADRLRRAA